MQKWTLTAWMMLAVASATLADQDPFLRESDATLRVGSGPRGGTHAGAAQTASAFVDLGGTTTDAVGLALDYDGVDNIFVKVQGQTATGQFSHIGFYMNDVGGGAWPGMTGGAAFFEIPAGETFSNGIIRVEHDGGGTVTLVTPKATYVRGGWAPNVGTVQAGFGFGRAQTTLDDFKIDDNDCDDFNRPDGPLGANWINLLDPIEVVGNAAKCVNPAFSKAIFVGQCGSGPCTGNEKIKKAKCKKGKLSVVTVGATGGSAVIADTQGQTKSATANGGGKAKIKFTGLPSGQNIVNVRWECGASAEKNYSCP